MARAEGVAGDGILFMEALEAEARTRIKPLPMNIDGALGRDPATTWASRRPPAASSSSSGASPG